MKVGEGVFIRLTEEEAGTLWGFLKENEYPDNAEGVKAFLFASMEDEEQGESAEEAESVPLRSLETYLKAHPEVLAHLSRVAGGALKSDMVSKALGVLFNIRK